MAKNTERKYPKEDEIRTRAYEIYESRGYEDGREVEHWLAAERELQGATGGEPQSAQPSTQSQQTRPIPSTQARPTPVAPPNKSVAAGQKRS